MSSDGVDIEASGNLQKKNRAGYYQSRYFKTTGSFLKYWQDKSAADRADAPAAVFDLRDCKSIERPPGGRQVNLIFSESDKFKLELKFLSDEECTSWTEVLLAKRALHSVSKLLIDLGEGINFRTRTFGTLMLLSERDRSQWIEDRLNDVFEAAADEARTKMLRSDPMWVIGAARVCIEELLVTCDECSLEMESRNPKVMAHCRNYMHRYADMIKGRLALELSFFTTTGSKRISEMGERALCAAIGLMTRMDALRSYTFMPHDLLPALNACLFSVGELMSALLNLSIERIEAWFRTVLALPPLQRGARLVEVIRVLANTLKLIDFQTDEDYLHQDLLFRVTMSILLNFSDQLVSIDLSEYDEQSLINHIRACHKIADELPSEIEVERPSHVQTAYNMYIFGHSSNVSASSGTGSGSASKTTSPQTSNKNISGKQTAANTPEIGGNSGSSAVRPISIELPAAVIDSVESACLTSARSAVVCAVQRLSASSIDLFDLLFQEKQLGWIGGAACDVYLNRFQCWLQEFAVSVPPQYEVIVKVELSRLVVRMYVDHAIKLYQDKKSFTLGVSGVEQVAADISAMQHWLDRLFGGIGRALEEYTFLGTMNSFLSCPEDAMLPCYAAAVQSFGIQYALHIYDLFRLFLKMRKSTDCKRRVRKSALGLCAEFLSQLRTALAADLTLMSGTRMTRKVGRLAKARMIAAGGNPYASAEESAVGAAQLADLLSYAPSISIFEELCPKVGVEHCTGKKWSLERASDPIAVRMLVARLVTETIASARSSHRESMEFLEREGESPAVADRRNDERSNAATATDELTASRSSTSGRVDAMDGEHKGTVSAKKDSLPKATSSSPQLLVDAMAAANITDAKKISPKSAGSGYRQKDPSNSRTDGGNEPTSYRGSKDLATRDTRSSEGSDDVKTLGSKSGLSQQVPLQVSHQQISSPPPPTYHPSRQTPSSAAKPPLPPRPSYSTNSSAVAVGELGSSSAAVALELLNRGLHRHGDALSSRSGISQSSSRDSLTSASSAGVSDSDTSVEHEPTATATATSSSARASPMMMMQTKTNGIAASGDRDDDNFVQAASSGFGSSSDKSKRRVIKRQPTIKDSSTDNARTNDDMSIAAARGSEQQPASVAYDHAGNLLQTATTKTSTVSAPLTGHFTSPFRSKIYDRSDSGTAAMSPSNSASSTSSSSLLSSAAAVPPPKAPLPLPLSASTSPVTKMNTDIKLATSSYSGRTSVGAVNNPTPPRPRRMFGEHIVTSQEEQQGGHQLSNALPKQPAVARTFGGRTGKDIDTSTTTMESKKHRNPFDA